MSANLKLIPRAERLLEGKITADMTDSQTTVTVDNPPAIASLPSYLEIDPDSATYRELCRVVNVSSSTITLERGLNNGGTGFPHGNNTSYKFKFTSRHWETVADALESGYLSEDSSYAFAQVSTSSFKITAATVDRTDLYTTGRKVRLNGTVILTVVSSSYSNPDTTIVVNGTTVPATITSVELAIATKGSTDIVTDNKASGTSVNAGLSESEIVTPKALADSDYIKLSDIPVSASFWTAFTGAYASATTITVATDLTGLFKKGVILKWLSSADAFKTGMVISSSYSAPNTTITIVGSTVESGDKTFNYAGELANKVTFIIPGNQSTGTDVSKTWFNPTPIYKLSVDAYNKTAGTTGNTVYDLNINGSTCITTKPTIASAGTSDIDNVCDTPATVVAAGSAFTVDIDTATTTQAIDGYIDLFYYPQSWVSLT